MADLQTLLSKFLNDLYAGTLGTTMPITAIRTGDGSASAPSYSFASDPDTGFFRTTTDTIGIAANGGDIGRFSTSGFFIGGQFIQSVNAAATLGFGGTVGSPDVSLSRGAAGRVDTTKAFRMTPVAFAALPTAAEGAIASVNDSNTNVWGATVAGGGANKVLVYYNGTNWTVAGK